MDISIKKLVIFTLALLLANFILSSYIDSVASANRGYNDNDVNMLVFLWTYIIIIPGIALVIGLLAALSIKREEPYLMKTFRSFLTTAGAIYLLFALPKFFIVSYKFIRDVVS